MEIEFFSYQKLSTNWVLLEVYTKYTVGKSGYLQN